MKSQRQAKILEIISTTNVETQEQLLQELEDAGFRSTQATISRDIKELRVIKELTSFGTYRYAVSTNEVSNTFSGKLNTIFRECITKFDYAQNILVIHTLPGLASAAGSAIDSMNLSIVVGTLAGDDTIRPAYIPITETTAYPMSIVFKSNFPQTNAVFSGVGKGGNFKYDNINLCFDL